MWTLNNTRIHLDDLWYHDPATEATGFRRAKQVLAADEVEGLGDEVLIHGGPPVSPVSRMSQYLDPQVASSPRIYYTTTNLR